MEWIQSLSKAINYIENNLTNPVSRVLQSISHGSIPVRQGSGAGNTASSNNAVGPCS